MVRIIPRDSRRLVRKFFSPPCSGSLNVCFSNPHTPFLLAIALPPSTVVRRVPANLARDRGTSCAKARAHVEARFPLAVPRSPKTEI